MELLSDTPGWIELTIWGKSGVLTSIRSRTIIAFLKRDFGTLIHTSGGVSISVTDTYENVTEAIKLDHARVLDAKGGDPFNTAL